jgi:hypothetical protein
LIPRLTMTALAAALALGACGRGAPSLGGRRMMAATQAAVCAAPQTDRQVQQTLFDAVAARAPAVAPAVRALNAQSRLTFRQAVLDSYDTLNDRTTCAGRLALVLPPSASGLLGGAAPAQPDVRYTIQPSADGRSLVYGLGGADALIRALAGADLSGWARRNAPAEPVGAAPSAVRYVPQAAIRRDPALSARLARLNEMLAVALARDVTGQVRIAHARALIALDACTDAPCVEAWFAEREAALGKWQT